MKLTYLLNICVVHILIFFFSTSLLAANINDCPTEKEELCSQIKELEEVYKQLPEQEHFETKNLRSPAYVLALGYAHLGNKEKAENYLKASEDAGFSKIEQKYNRTGILKQYMLQGQYDEAFTYLEKEDVHSSLCKASVQIFAYQNRTDLIKKLLTQTKCSPKSLSKGAAYLNKDEIIALYKELKDIKQTERASQNTGLFSALTQAFTRGGLQDELNDLITLIAKKSFAYDEAPSIPEFIEQDALLNKDDIKTLISFYAEQNDLKALEIFKNNKHKFKHPTDILPSYNLEHTPTELSLLIFNEIEDTDQKFKLLEQLLRFVSRKSALSQKRKFEHITDMCSNMTFSQCIAANLPKEKITEKLGLDIDVYTSNYEHLREFEANNKTVEQDEVLTIQTNADGNYAIVNNKEPISKPPLWGVHVLIAHKDDCDKYYHEDIEKIQKGISDKDEYTGNDPYFAVQCLVTINEHEDLLVKASTKEYSWLSKQLRKSYYNTFSQSYEQLVQEASNLDKNISKEIAGAIITVLFREVDDKELDLSFEQKEAIFSTIDNYVTNKNNYDAVIVNKAFVNYFNYGQKEHAYSIVDKLPEFQKYIENNYESASLGKPIRSAYKVPFDEYQLINKSNRLSWEIFDTVNRYNEFNASAL
jgi:hypothetical protein